MQLNKTTDLIKAKLARLKGSPGLIFKEDDRDIFEDELGVGFIDSRKPKYDHLSYYRYDYDQNPNNTCTQASVGLALSEQMSVRFSVDAITKTLVKEGKIRGNGFCSQTPPMGVAVEHGVIPHHLYRDKIGESWNTKKRWDTSLEMLYESSLKLTDYRRLQNEQAVIEALDKGFVPIVASRWDKPMNNPLPPDFFLKFGEYTLGGHQYRITGYRKTGDDFQNGQTFGASYGDKGKAYNDTVFGSGYYQVWIITYEGKPLPPIDKLLPIFLIQHEGLLLKTHDWYGDPRCYLIQNGKRCWVSGEDNMQTFFSLNSKVGLTRVNQTLLEAVPEGDDYPLIT